METKPSCTDCGTEIVDVWSIALLPKDAPANYGVIVSAGVRCVACHRARNTPEKVAARQAVIDQGRKLQADNRKPTAAKPAPRRRPSALVQQQRALEREQRRLDGGGHPWAQDEE